MHLSVVLGVALVVAIVRIPVAFNLAASVHVQLLLGVNRLQRTGCWCLIGLALYRMIQNTSIQQMPFANVGAIVKMWISEGIRTPQAVDKKCRCVSVGAYGVDHRAYKYSRR